MHPKGAVKKKERNEEKRDEKKRERQNYRRVGPDTAEEDNQRVKRLSRKHGG